MSGGANGKYSKPLSFSARGKLLLSAEYLVARGALALALPVRFGQTLTIEPFVGGVMEASGGEGDAQPQAKSQTKSQAQVQAQPQAQAQGDESSRTAETFSQLIWNASTEKEGLWLSARFSLQDFSISSWKSYGLDEPDNPIYAERLQKLLVLCRQANPDFLIKSGTILARTHANFPRQWGLGTSSTLLSLLGQWSGADPFDLQREVFGGSGYDVACAQAEGPILYKLVNGKPVWEPVAFAPPFAEHLMFVYLGQKQDSAQSLAAMEGRLANAGPWIHTIVHLTMQLRFAETLSDFAQHLRKHEEVISSLTGLPTVQSLHFADFDGVIKSLGAWGGDFVLICSAQPESAVRSYFAQRGFDTMLTWNEMVG